LQQGGVREASSSGRCLRGAWRQSETLQRGGVREVYFQGSDCVEYGATVNFCSQVGCTKRAARKGGVCAEHGEKKRFSREGLADDGMVGNVVAIKNGPRLTVSI
jgi:hypothetical protein